MKTVMYMFLLLFITNCNEFQSYEKSYVIENSYRERVDPKKKILRHQRASQEARATDLTFSVITDSPNGIKEIIWDFDHSEGALCDFTTENSSKTLVVNCVESGNLELVVFVYYHSGHIQREQASIVLLEEGEPIDEPSPVNPINTLNGEDLYSQNCMGCHQGIQSSTKRGSTFQSIQSAINNNVGGMGFIDLSTEEIKAISEALK